MTDEQFHRPAAHPAGKLDGVLDSLAGDDPRRLQEEDIAVSDPHVGPEGRSEGVGRRRRACEIEHVGNHRTRDAFPVPQLLARFGVYDDMRYGIGFRGEGHGQVLLRGVDHEALAFP